MTGHKNPSFLELVVTPVEKPRASRPRCAQVAHLRFDNGLDVALAFFLSLCYRHNPVVQGPSAAVISASSVNACHTSSSNASRENAASSFFNP